MYKEKGVIIDQDALVQGGAVELTYSGDLFRNGAEEVYVHLGFGLLWEGLNEISMTKSIEGFTAEISLLKADALNLCFRDNKNNWDNNSYLNYSFELKRSAVKKSATKIKEIANEKTMVNDEVLVHKSCSCGTKTHSTKKTSEKANDILKEPILETTLEKASSSEQKLIKEEIITSSTIINPKHLIQEKVETPIHTFQESTSNVSCEITKDATSQVDLGQSLVPSLNSEFSQFRRLPENYLRSKKMRIMFYRMFAYIPRLLNGHNKRRAKSILKNGGLF